VSALFNQLGMVKETTYGTRVAPTRFMEFTAEAINKVMPRVVSAGHRPGDEAVRYDHWINGRTGAAGTFDVEVANKGMGILWDLGMGSTTQVADGAGYHYTTKLGDQAGKSMTLQLGRGDTGGTGVAAIDPFDYTGTKVVGLAFTQAIEAYLHLQVTVDAQKEDTTQALAAATLPAVTEIFHWDQLTVSFNGVVPTRCSQVDFHITTPMRVDRWFAGQPLKSEPIRNAKRDVGGTLACEFESMTNYNLAVNALPTGTPVPIILTWTGVTTYDVSKPFKLVVTFNQCRCDPDTPNTVAEDVIPLNIPFVAMQGAAETVTVDYYTSDTAI
jgi:hypothetical protein